MKNKKCISIILCILMIFTSVLSVSAASTMDTAGSKDVNITYGVSQEFVVTIPTNFEIDTSSKAATAIVSASNVMISSNAVLEVSISGHDYADSWELIDETESANTLTYTIGTTAGATDIINNSVVLSVNAGEAYNSTVNETLYFTVVDELSKSGTYKDILTFNVQVVGDDSAHQGLYFNQPYKGVHSDPNNYLEAEITVDEAGNAKAWIGMVENEYAMYMEMPITFTNEEVFGPDDSLIGEILNNGKTVNFFFNDEITIEMNLSKAVTPTAPLPGTYVNSLENAYITLDENGVVNGYVNDELYATGSINDGIVHPSGKHIAALPVGNGIWYAFSSTSIQPEYSLVIDIPQAISDEDRINEYVFLYNTSDGEGDDGIEGWANLAMIVSSGMTEFYKISDDVFTEEFVESLNVKVQDFTTGKTFSNILLEKSYGNTYTFPNKESLGFVNDSSIPNIYKTEAGDTIASNNLTLKTENNIITYAFEEVTENEDENGAFFSLVIVPESGYHASGTVYELSPGTYIFSYSPDYAESHNLKITFTK